ncbi:MAG: adenylate/guanylate cyclase domain-containing protein [Chloroflexi bacterium]|nr:adenylate/guanylate cyclase domain-containing protein [Chloroflexota bacterium]
MEPQIQYAKTSDGVSIAYYAIGQGPAVLYLILPPSHLEAEWQIESFRVAYTAIAQTSTFVRLDPRGFGLSDRNPDDFAVDSIVLDIEAVVDRLGLDEMSIYSWGAATIPALVYTARHPERVTHLVQTPPAASAQDMRSPQIDKLVELAEIDSDLLGEIMTRMMNPDLGDQVIKEITELGNAAIEPSEAGRFVEEAMSWDADADAISLSTPTLLIHQRNSKGFSNDKTRRVAGLIPNSRVVFVDNIFEGAVLAQRFFQGTLDSTEPASAETATSPEAGAMRTILFSDIEDSTEMTERLGDRKARDLLREHERITREALNAHGGSEVKTMGDGFMASFSSATRSLECAIAIQQAFAERNETADEPINVRIGLNAGEPIAEDDPGGRGDLFGTAVNLAARIAAKAEAGEILVADVVRQLVAGKEFLFNDRGETELRGFEDPVRVYEVRWRD